MNLYRFKGYGWAAPSWHIVAPTFYDAWTTAEADGIRWCEVELLASDDDAAWPKEAPKKRLTVRGLPADAEKDAPVPIPTVFHNPRGVVPNASVTDALAAARRRLLSDKDARIVDLERKLAELTDAAQEMFRAHEHPGTLEACGAAWQRLRAVLDAQRGEKEEPKP